MRYFKDFDPVRFGEDTFLIKGKPIKLYNSSREYLSGIYHSMAYKMPGTARPIVFVKGRQVEMTTTSTVLSFYFLNLYRHFCVLYSFPTATQAKRFSEERIDNMLRYKLRSDILEPLNKGTDTKNVKQFQNGSTLYIYGVTSEGGDNLRNIGADMLIKDEYQDLDPSAEGNMNEIISHSEFKMNIILGTPKDTGSSYEKMWELSDKRYFFLPCPICKKDFTISRLEDLTPGFGCKCPNCGNIEDKRDLISKGKWVPTDTSQRLVGFHLSQTYVPTSTKENLLTKIADEEAKGTDTTRYTKNEILGEFFSGLRVRVSLANIEKAYDRSAGYNIYIPVTRPVYMGVDWGGSSSLTNDPNLCYTVASIGTWNNAGQLYVNYVEILNNPDEMEQANRVGQLMKLYNVKTCVADSGYGKIKNFALKKEFGPNRFIACKYLQGSAATLFADKGDGYIHVNRDYALEELYADMGYGKIIIPDNEKTEWTKQHFLNFEIENVVHGGVIYKHFQAVKKDTAKTDAVHSINYLRIAALLEDKRALNASPLAEQASHRVPRPILGGQGSEGFLPGMRNVKEILIPRSKNLITR